MPLGDYDPSGVLHGDARRVVGVVLQILQGRQENLHSVIVVADMSGDPTHQQCVVVPHRREARVRV